MYPKTDSGIAPKATQWHSSKQTDDNDPFKSLGET